MSAIDRGRGRGGMRGGPGGAQASRGRGVWRGGPPPGSASYPTSRGASPATPGAGPGAGAGAGPRTSINDHMNDMKKMMQDTKGKGFQTDTDISKSSGLVERELKPWVPDAAVPNGPQSNGGPTRDSDTFGSGATNIPWDQFETNERLFGAKTNFQEELYTTKLNKNGVDFKKREKDAERLAAEIMGTTVKNIHVLEERGQAGEESAKDEEEKYSGVVRAPGAYVPPGARRGGGVAVGPRASAPPAPTPSPAPVPVAVPVKTNGSTAPSPAPQPAKAASPAPAPVPSATITPPPGPPRSTSEDPPSTLATSAIPIAAQPAVEAPAAAGSVPAPTGAEAKADGQLGGVVNQWRNFVGSEKERIETKKQSMIKSERDRQLADLKKFHANFKVPLPMPKDILPILSKDEVKQKDIEAKAASALESAREAKKLQGTPSPVKISAAMESAKTEAPKSILTPKKPFMKIPEIPPFNSAKKKAVVAAPTIPVPETANQNIPQLATSPTPSNISLASGSQARLNPKANTFVFKPNPGAAVFKPGQPSTGSPAAQTPRQLPPSGSSVASPAPVPAAPKNPFFKDKAPERIAVDPRHDFSPWKHGSGQVPNSTTIGLQWPYSGRKSHVPQFGAPMAPIHVPPFGEEDAASPSPHAAPPPLMPGVPPNYPPYGYRFSQPGLPPQAIPGQMGSPMFSPGPQYVPLPGQQMGQQPPQHLGPGGPQANGMPMYFQGGMPQNPQFIPPQHMHYNPHNNPHTPQRHGPGHAHGPGSGPGGPGGPGGPQMFYPNQVTTPHQTPQLQHNLPFPPQPPQFNHQHSHTHSPMTVNQLPHHPGQGGAPAHGHGQGQGQGQGQGGSTGNVTPGAGGRPGNTPSS